MSALTDILANLDRTRRLAESLSTSAVVRQHLDLAKKFADQSALNIVAQYRPPSGIVSAAFPGVNNPLDASRSFSALARSLAPSIDTSQLTSMSRAIEGMVGPWNRLQDLSRTFRAFEDRAHEYGQLGSVVRRWAEQHLGRMRIEKRLARFGWVGLDRLFDDDELTALGECLLKHGRVKAEARIVRRMRRHNHAVVRSAASRWRQLPTLRRRRKAVLAALRAHRVGDYVLSIPALWPLLDAVAADCQGLVRPRGTAHVKTAARHAADTSALETALKVFLRTNTGSRPHSTSNRHDVLHGRAINYGTEANSCRVILLLDVYVQLTIAALKRKVQAKP